MEGTTGYGISTELGDWNHPTIFVNVKDQTVVYGGDESSTTFRVFTFQEFLETEDLTIGYND